MFCTDTAYAVLLPSGQVKNVRKVCLCTGSEFESMDPFCVVLPIQVSGGPVMWRGGIFLAHLVPHEHHLNTPAFLSIVAFFHGRSVRIF